ncbi:MAG: hypothetical protein ACRDAQ_10880 [Cetobacterium sp.]
MNKFTEKIIIEPKYIDSHLETYILSKLKKQELSCTKNGFIKQVVNIEKILPEEISMADGSISFCIEWSGVIIKPEVGKTLTTTRFLFYLEEDDKVLVDIDGMFHCLIVNGKMVNNLYTFPDCGCAIDINKDNINIDVVLIAVEFKDKKFMTLGQHSCRLS